MLSPAGRVSAIKNEGPLIRDVNVNMAITLLSPTHINSEY